MSTLMPVQVPTALPPEAFNTIVALTAQAAATQTAALLPPTETPTWTPVPSKTPSPTPSPTPTFLFVLATLTRVPSTPTLGPASKDFACVLIDQTPADGASISKNQTFSVSWTVQNTGFSTWDATNTDFANSGGTKMTSVKRYDLPKSVAAGDTTVLKVTMQAPSSPDTYKTVWTLRNGKDLFCRVDLTIVVQ